jgi:hypothetical protein
MALSKIGKTQNVHCEVLNKVGLVEKTVTVMATFLRRSTENFSGRPRIGYSAAARSFSDEKI